MDYDELRIQQPEDIQAALDNIVDKAGTSDADWSVLLAAASIIAQLRAEDKGDRVPVRCVTYVGVENLIPADLIDKFWEAFDDAPFSWGENDHSLIPGCAFIGQCEARLTADNMGMPQEDLDKLMDRIRRFNRYRVDLEVHS